MSIMGAEVEACRFQEAVGPWTFISQDPFSLRAPGFYLPFRLSPVRITCGFERIWRRCRRADMDQDNVFDLNDFRF